MAVATQNNHSDNPLEQFLARICTLNWERILYIVILLLAIFTRFYLLGDRVMSHDESLHTRFSFNLYADGNFQHTPLMHGPILFHVTAFFYFLFGDNDFTSRMYTSILGVLVVMSPLLFRRWLGRWGTILAMVMLLISPLMLYYNRYIRHDTPSILYAILMAYAILMYLNGPENQRRRAHWLYLIGAAMILNLGSKETAFIYIAIFGTFMALYWFARLAQHYLRLPGKTLFYFGMTGILLAGTLALGLYIILDIIKFDMFSAGEARSFAALPSSEQTLFFIWSLMAVAAVMAVVFGTLFWAYRDRLQRIPWRELLLLVLLLVAFCFVFIAIEERSHIESRVDASRPVAPLAPDGEGAVTDFTTSGSITWWPMALTWGAALLVLLALPVSKVFGFWREMDRFPEFDVIIVIGTLILPWATAFVPFLMHPTGSDAANLAQSLPQPLYNLLFNLPTIGSPDRVGQVWLGFLAWLPLMALAVAIGLMWNWRRWLVTAIIFHTIFAFFFTTVFTNMAGLGTGMVYSLGYWLEQQGERRGSQPQYYYLLIIMPFYEFLPVIGSVLAMIAGMVTFWRRRRPVHDLLDGLEGKAKRKPHEESPVTPYELEAAADNAAAVDYTDTQTDPDISYEEDFSGEDAAETRRLREQLEQHTQLVRIPFLLFVGYWAILNLIGYTLAGEKMPWLGTHLTTPMILLSAWYFGRIFDRLADRLEIQKLWQHGWALLIVLPMLFVGFFQVVWPFFVGRTPFTGLQQLQLQQTYSWLAVVALCGVLIYIAFYVASKTGWGHFRRVLTVALFLVLSLLTFRSAWMASFINYDLANEFLVYAHAAPAIKTVLDDIEHLSLRTSDGLNMKFAYDNLVSWPYSWYFRNFNNAVFVGSNPTVQNLDGAIVVVVGEGNRGKVEPILEDRYYRFDYIRMWWPMQDYFNLTADRVLNAFDFSPENPNSGMIRQGMFDIWWSRDYSTYGAAVQRDFSLARWPVADRMYVYVRKDFAAQTWTYGVGDGTVLNPLAEIEVNQCTANWQTMFAVAVFESPPTPFNRPLGIDIGPDGLVYVAEEFSHRISVYNQDGEFLHTIGSQGSGPLNFVRPNSVTIGADGAIYVADTWNYRIQALTANGEYVTEWGQPGEYGFAAVTMPVDGFWGPRDVAVDAAGNIYVADTGNKRIRVYRLDDGQAVFVMDIGSGGSAPGQLDEPSGIAVHPDGRIYIADTWNRRISVFTSDGLFLTSFPVRGWYEELGNRPYLALDPIRNLLYVTDPDAGRVLVYDTDGNCVGAFGQPAGDVYDTSQFRVVTGIVVDADGYVYVTDSSIGRVLKFESFAALAVRPEVEQQAVEMLPEPDDIFLPLAEVTAEVTELPEATSETGAEE